MGSKWNKGAPPAVGWWPASNRRDPLCWSWWDGSNWSWGCAAGRSSRDAAESARILRTGQGFVEWRDWPKAMRHLPSYPLNSIPSQEVKP